MTVTHMTIDGEECSPDSVWDVIVVGTGLGGATIGHRLTQNGYRVLFLEKGKASFVYLDNTDVTGVQNPDDRLDLAHWPDRITTSIDGHQSDFFAPLGCGAGGSSQLYAAALERFERSDIESIEHLPHPTGGWPLSWTDLAEYYAQAERLYAIRGTIDPLAEEPATTSGWDDLMSPPPASPIDAQLMRDLEAAGLHPYRLHVGFAYQPGCSECGGRPCRRRCKSDAAHICLEPALRGGQSELRTQCDVVRIEADARQVRGVVYRDRDGVLQTARGRMVVLAAGAYRSPALMLSSRSPEWPTGLGNRSDQVGRHLMFHANEWFAVWPTKRASVAGPRKTIGLRDLYTCDGVRLGSIQSTGLTASDHNIYRFLIDTLERNGVPRWLRPSLLLKVVARIAARLFGEATVLVMLVEDLGYPDNRVMLDAVTPGLIRVNYSIRKELRERSRLARSKIKQALKSLRTFPLHADIQLNYGHPCGTCRAGDNPETSVLDGTCKAHGLDNLYVVDASFMPTSAGTNLGLTIIANALRVGDIIAGRLEADDAILRCGASDASLGSNRTQRSGQGMVT